jgi:DNA-binding transcriptional MerR regulator
MLHTMQLDTVQLMPIGRFSRLTGVGVKALRHYDEVGLLVPAAVDDETGYRFYSPDQVDRAEAIRLLRRLDMPLDEIRSTLAAEDPAALRAALVSHQRQMASRDSELRASIARLQRLIDGRERIMGMRSESLEAEEHRRLGIDLYNRTWTLMDSPGDEMLHCAHASAYHWMQGGGTTANRARSEWLCSRVYSILGRPEPALQHARRCIELVESAPSEMEDWDKAGAYEALTRAHLAAGEMEEARRFLELAREETAKIAEEDDRKHIEADIDSLAPSLGG